MVDIFLRQGAASPADVTLSDPTVGSGAAIRGDATADVVVAAAAIGGREIFAGATAAVVAVTAANGTARETFGDEFGGVDYVGGEVIATLQVIAVAGAGRQIIRGNTVTVLTPATSALGTARETVRGDVIAITSSTANGMGREALRGPAAAVVPVSGALDAGREVFRGSATEIAPATTALGAGTERFRGPVSVLASITDSGGAAREIARGHASSGQAVTAARSEGSVPTTGDVIATFPVLQADATGLVLQDIAGALDVVLPVTQASSRGSIPVEGWSSHRRDRKVRKRWTFAEILEQLRRPAVPVEESLPHVAVSVPHAAVSVLVPKRVIQGAGTMTTHAHARGAGTMDRSLLDETDELILCEAA